MKISCRLLMLCALHASLLVSVTVDAFNAGAICSIRRQACCWSRHGRLSDMGAISGDQRRSSGVARADVGREVARPEVPGNTCADEAFETLLKAVKTRSVPKGKVSAALGTLIGGPWGALEVSDVEGSYEIVFSTQLGNGYMPVKEIVGFYPSRDQFAIDTTFGPVALGSVRGECSWNGGPSNELTFAVSAAKFGPLTFAREPEPKTYQFFVSKGELRAARSSAGGLCLLLRVQ